MNTNTHTTTARFLIAAAAAACVFLAGPVLASDHTVTVRILVKANDLDLTQPSGAREYYGRIGMAARIACSHGNRVGLERPLNPRACYETALGEAIRYVNLPQLTQVYLASHTLQDAVARGIEIPVQVAAK